MRPTGRKNAQAGDLLPVSVFAKYDTADGIWEVGTASYEKRGVEAFVPVWNKDNCILCNQYAYICPHVAIHPFVLTDDELAGFDGLETLDMKTPAVMKGTHFVIKLSILDYLGCGNCADICPGNPKLSKTLTMVPLNPDAANMKKRGTQRLPRVFGRALDCRMGQSTWIFYKKRE